MGSIGSCACALRANHSLTHVYGYERQLGKDAAALGGRNDGWGCCGRE